MFARDCGSMVSPILQIKAYFRLALLYSNQNEYANGIKCLKRLLEIAWANNYGDWEIKAYEELGRLFYYMGRSESSKNYNDRAARGLKISYNFKLILQ